MKKLTKTASIFSLALALLPNLASAGTGDEWTFGASIYGWFPDISGTTAFPDGSGNDFVVPIGTILDNLSFTLQGGFDARKGKWGIVTDVIYMDLNKKESEYREGTIGGQEIPVDVTAKVGLGMKSWIWTTAAYYRVIDQPEKSFDLLFGARYLDISQSLDFSFSGNIGGTPLPGHEASAKVGGANWDAVVGLRGRFSFGQGNQWFMPYLLDVGTGDTDLTWQAMAGIGYAFKWGEMIAAWRYLEYDMPSDKPIDNMNFSGPVVGAVFRW